MWQAVLDCNADMLQEARELIASGQSPAPLYQVLQRQIQALGTL
jgi:hypothetical protein